MSDPLGMKAHCSDKRLIQSSLHHIHTPCSLIHPHTPISNPKSTQFSIYQIICSPLNKLSTKSLLWQTFPKGFHKQGHSVFLVHGAVVSPLYMSTSSQWWKEGIFLLMKFSGQHISKMDCSCFTPRVFCCTRKGNMYLASRTSKRMAPSQAHTGLTCCMRGGKDNHNRPVVCQLGGYNYWEEGGEKEFHCGSAFRSYDMSHSRAPDNTLLLL